MASQHHPHARTSPHTRAELRFVPRAGGRPSLCFPCDASGRVDIDALSDGQRTDYLFARALRGRDYAAPVVSTDESAALAD